MPLSPYRIGGGGISAATTFTVTTSTTAGDAIFVVVSCSSILTAPTDTQGNTYQILAADTTNDVFMWASTYKGSSGTPTAALVANTDKISWTTAATGQISCGACSGLSAVNVDVNPASVRGTSTSPAQTIGPMSQSGDLVVAGLGCGLASGGTITWTAPLSQFSADLASGNATALASTVDSTTASVACGATLSGSVPWTFATAAFFTPSVPVSGPNPSLMVMRTEQISRSAHRIIFR